MILLLALLLLAGGIAVKTDIATAAIVLGAILLIDALLDTVVLRASAK